MVHFVYRPRSNRFHLIRFLHREVHVFHADSGAVVVEYLLEVWLEDFVVNVRLQILLPRNERQIAFIKLVHFAMQILQESLRFVAAVVEISNNSKENARLQ